MANSTSSTSISTETTAMRFFRKRCRASAQNEREVIISSAAASA